EALEPIENMAETVVQLSHEAMNIWRVARNRARLPEAITETGEKVRLIITPGETRPFLVCFTSQPDAQGIVKATVYKWRTAIDPESQWVLNMRANQSGMAYPVRKGFCGSDIREIEGAYEHLRRKLGNDNG